MAMAMATEEDYELELTCLIEGDPKTFLVTLPRTALVDRLGWKWIFGKSV